MGLDNYLAVTANADVWLHFMLTTEHSRRLAALVHPTHTSMCTNGIVSRNTTSDYLGGGKWYLLVVVVGRAAQ